MTSTPKYASVRALMIIMGLLLWMNDELRPWTWKKVIDWDVISYYSYLPAVFIHHNIRLEFTDGNDEFYHNRQFWPTTAPNGAMVIKTTMGMAILYAPFFGIAHAEAWFRGHEMDGYSPPYHKWIHFSALFYLFLGLLALRKLLLFFFSDKITALSLLLIILGTNAFHYSTFETAVSHMFSFSLISILLWLFVKWHQKQSYSSSILIGLVGGLVVLIRPTNILIFIFFALFGMSKKTDILKQLRLFLHSWKHILLIALFAFLVNLPQLLYWKSLTGHWIFNSYVGEGFFFNKPQILNGLFSYRKGWFLYTPLMLLATLGFIQLWKNHKKLFWGSFTYLLLTTYVVFSWWCWWYGGSFGMRSMVDAYPLMAIPLAALLHAVYSRKKHVQNTIFTLLLAGIVWLNFHQSKQFREGVIHWDSMTKEAYWKGFWLSELDEAHYQLFETPNYEKAKKGEREN